MCSSEEVHKFNLKGDFFLHCDKMQKVTEPTCTLCDTINISGKYNVCLVCSDLICEQCHSNKRVSKQHQASHPMQLVLPPEELLRKGQIIETIKHLCCPVCGDKEFNQMELFSHYEKYHEINNVGEDENNDTYRCPICAVRNYPSTSEYLEITYTCSELSGHFSSYHGMPCGICDAKATESWYVCLEPGCLPTAICDNCYDDKRSKKGHKPYHPMQHAPTPIEFNQLLQSNTNNFRALKIFRCPFCDEKGFKIRDLVEHCQKYHSDQGSRPERCPVCVVLRFPSKLHVVSLLEHLKTCHDATPDAATEPPPACCTICIEEMARDVQFLRCGHGFHRSCVANWLRDNGSCPICRTNANAIVNILRPLHNRN